MMREWVDQQKDYKQVMRLFNETFRNENNKISKTTVVRTSQHFEKSGSVRNHPKSGRLVVATNENKVLNVLQSFVEDSYTSINRIAQQHKIGAASVYKILKKNKWRPCKLHLIQESSEDDFDRRVQFCDLIMEMIKSKMMILYFLIISKRSFTLTILKL